MENSFSAFKWHVVSGGTFVHAFLVVDLQFSILFLMIRGNKLGKSRKNTDYNKLDTLAVKLQGGPFSNLYTDIIKYPEFIFSEEYSVCLRN